MSKIGFALFLFAAACTSDGTSSTSSEIRGTTTYRDAETDHAGQPTEPAAPTGGVTIEMVISGTGTLPQVDARCALDPAGQFQATFVSTANVTNGNAYVAALGEGTIATPSGCELPSISGMIVTDVKIRAELDATTQNCEAYCAANARADAEAECGATASSAQCRESAEASAMASCTTTCTTQSTKIAAEASLATALFGDLDFDRLQAAAFGDLEANLTFDRLE